jgi:hypothetical protein
LARTIEAAGTALAFAIAAFALPAIPAGAETRPVRSHVYGEVHDKADLHHTFALIRADVGKATTRVELTRLYRRARYLVTLTYSHAWRTRFGAEAASMTETARRELETTVAAINQRSGEIGTEADYG